MPRDNIDEPHSYMGATALPAPVSWVPSRSRGFYCCLVTLSHVLVVFAAGIVAKVVYIDLILDQHQEFLPYVTATTILGFSQYLFFKKMGLFKLESMLDPTIGLGKVWGALGLSFLILLGILCLLAVPRGRMGDRSAA